MVAKLKFASLIVLVLTFSMACEKVFDGDNTLVLETDRMFYALGDTVHVRIINPTSEAVYLRRCGPVSYRFSLVAINENTGEKSVVVPDNCRSFNQLRVGINGGKETRIAIPLTFNIPRGTGIDGLYEISFYLAGTINPEPDSSLFNRTNPFVITETR